MRVGVLTREWPPEVYGGAGVHVEHLVAALRRSVTVDVHCFGEPRADAQAHPVWVELAAANPVLGVLSADLSIAAAVTGCDLLHSHTWYANLAGHVGALVHGVPHVVTTHSLEPRRPWKREQLGGGYDVSCWAERTALSGAAAVIAVSAGMRADLLDAYPDLPPGRIHVIHNGIDPAAYRPAAETGALRRLGIDPGRPAVVFVGRITRQKGVEHLIGAAADIDASAQLVLCAGAPDTPELGREVSAAVAELQRRRNGVVWIREMLAREDVVEVLSSAAVFVCPSVYEPLGIVNLEAMACGTPVVASDVGGIPEVVADGETGLLVHYDAEDPAGFRDGLAAGVNELLADPDRAARMGAAGRARAVREFSWDAAARRTLEVYSGCLR